MTESNTPTGASAQPRSADGEGGVLVVSPSFFGYEHDIVRAFSDLGSPVDFVDERPGNSSLLRAALRLRLPLTGRLVDKHFKEELARLKGRRLRLVLIVKGESTPVWFLERLRAAHPGVRIVFYAYDRITEGQNCLDLIPSCDAAYSFDPVDVTVRSMRYKPLFHGDSFTTSIDYSARRWDASFVGTAHSDRYAYATKIAAAVGRSQLFFYSPARWYFAAQKYLGRLKGVPWSAVSFAKMPKDAVAETFGNSRAVIDLQRDGQSGLTMRTFEVLASGAKLITTNESARDLEGVPDGAVLVLPFDEVGSSAQRIAEFVAKPAPAAMTDGRYSLREWVAGFLEDARHGVVSPPSTGVQ